jgi:hypothetical protein
VSEKPAPEDFTKWHRWFAVDCNNAAWSLAGKASRTAAEDRDMLNRAYAAAYHWSRIGQPVNDARADLLVAHAHAVLGHGELALQYARRRLAFFEGPAAEDWDQAFAHAEMAYAAAAAGDKDLHATHYAQALECGRAIQDEEDRRIFLEEFSRIPAAVRA